MCTLRGDESVLYEILSSRVTLLLPGVSIAEVPAGTHRDLQTGSIWVVVKGKLQFSHHTDVLKDTAVHAVAAAAAALRGPNTEKADDAWDWSLALMLTCELQQELMLNDDLFLNSILVLPSSPLNTVNQRKSLLLPQWMIPPGHCLCLF